MDGTSEECARGWPDRDPDRARNIGGDDEPGRKSGGGPIAGRVAERGDASHPQELALRGDVEQGGTDRGCRASGPGDQRLAHPCWGNETLGRRPKQSAGLSPRAHEPGKGQDSPGGRLCHHKPLTHPGLSLKAPGVSARMGRWKTACLGAVM